MGGFKAVTDRQIGAIAHARAQAAAPLKAHVSSEELLGLPFTPGQRVLDVDTGRVGTVRSAAICHTIVPPAAAVEAAAAPAFFQLPAVVNKIVVTVALDDGTIVARAPKSLIELPASLNVPLAHLVVNP